MCPSLIQMGSKTAEKNSAQTNKQTNRHYENNGHLAVNQLFTTTTTTTTTSVERPFFKGNLGKPAPER